MRSGRVWSSAIALLAATSVFAQSPSPAAATTKQAGNAYRYRLLGVYDEQSGDPIEGVEITDVFNRTKSSTTKTGPVSLFFLPDGGAVVSIRKLGYEPQQMTVAISPADTTPITVILKRATQQLPTVVVNDAANKAPSLSPTMVTRPGPMMMSNVSSRANHVLRGAISPRRMVPQAP